MHNIYVCVTSAWTVTQLHFSFDGEVYIRMLNNVHNYKMLGNNNSTHCVYIIDQLHVS